MIWSYHNKGLWRPERESNIFDGGAPYYRCYRCRDGRYVALGAIEEAFWNTFLDLCGIDDEDLRTQRNDRSKWPELRHRLEGIFATRDSTEWCALTEGTDACLTPVLDFEEAAAEQHALARGAFVTADGACQPAPAPRFGRTPGQVALPSPWVGEHTRQILGEAGFSEQEIEALEAGGVVEHAEERPAKAASGPLG
jgi:alpha-methylacyl-CoA racemase